MNAHIVNLRGGPGSDGWRPPTAPPAYSARLTDRIGLVLVAAPEVGALPEHFGLGAYLVVTGRSVLAAGLILPNGLESKERATAEAWARRQHHDTPSGSRRWAVVTLSEFFDPCHGVFVKTVYTGAGWCIGANLGRIFGLYADHVVERRGKNVGSWEIWLPGWGTEHERGRTKRTSPHRPPLRISPRRVGWQVRFGPCEKSFGKYEGSRQWQGAFLDVLSLGYALDADRGASFAEHRENVGLPSIELPVAVTPGANAAQQMANAVQAVHELAVELDQRASDWFTTSEDRTEGRGRLDLARTVSPGGVAAGILGRSGAKAPMETFRLSDDEHRRWSETFHGGWCQAHPQVIGRSLAAVSVDVSSCFPLVAHHAGWWNLLRAERINRKDVGAELRSLCERAAADPTVILDPAIWRQFGCCLVEVIPDGEPLPVEIEDALRPDGRTEVVPVFSPDRPMWFSALDVLAAAVLSGRPPQIISGTGYAPIGRQPGLRRRLPVLPGLVLGPDDDPAVALVRHRRKAKAAGDPILAAELRVVVNSMVYGGLCRFDESLVKQGRNWVRSERPGPWSSMPIASSVTAGSHLLLAVLDRLVSDRGGIVAYRDTDSSITPASPNGSAVELADGMTARSLSWAEIDRVIAAFSPLAPDGNWPVWKVERGTSDHPLRSLVFGPKRHAEIVGDELVDLTEAGLGGTFADPATMTGRGDEGYRQWSAAAVRCEVELMIAREHDSQALRPAALWDEGQPLRAPAIRRYEVKHPEQLRALPDILGARPGTRYIEVSGAGLRSSDRTFVALDPGGDLAGWKSLQWLNKGIGAPVRVTTDPMDLTSEVIETLDDRAVRYSELPRSQPVDAVVVVPNLIALRGRVSGVIYADEDGLGDLRAHRPMHQDADRAAAVQAEAARLGKRAFARRTGLPVTVAERAAASKPISAANVDKALLALRTDPDMRPCELDGCEMPVGRPNARYCSKVHRDQAYRARAKNKVKAVDIEDDDDEEICPRCGMFLIGVPANDCPGCAKQRRSGDD